ncbi:MAG: hypothetical protein ACK4OO_07870, partial [bacterium]
MRKVITKSSFIAKIAQFDLQVIHDALGIAIILIVGLTLISLNSYAQKKREIPKARNARHIVMPFLGYQTYSGEELSARFTLI